MGQANGTTVVIIGCSTVCRKASVCGLGKGRGNTPLHDWTEADLLVSLVPNPKSNGHGTFVFVDIDAPGVGVSH